MLARRCLDERGSDTLFVCECEQGSGPRARSSRTERAVTHCPSRSQIGGRVDRVSRILSGRCRPWRSSICDRCHQRPGAIYPEARASSPRTPPQTRVRILLILLQVGFTDPPQSPGMLVVSYTAVSPLPPSLRCQAPHRLVRGGLFSVALSRGSPRVGVTHHLALRSPDFPRCRIRDAAIV